VSPTTSFSSTLYPIATPTYFPSVSSTYYPTAIPTTFDENQNFSYIGHPEPYFVPNNVNYLFVEACGAKGASGVSDGGYGHAKLVSHL
jgi:hypothetical protein